MAKSLKELGAQLLPFSNRMLIERLPAGMSIDGTPFFEAGSHALKERRGGTLLPICKHHARMIGFSETLHEGKECPLTARRPFKQIRIA